MPRMSPANTQAPGVSAALQAGETVPAEGTGGGEGATDVLSGAPGGRMAVRAVNSGMDIVIYHTNDMSRRGHLRCGQQVHRA